MFPETDGISNIISDTIKVVFQRRLVPCGGQLSVWPHWSGCRDTHSVGSICDHDFGVFTVTNIATENTDAVLPAHPLPRTPKAANQGLQRCRGPRVPLTCLAPLAAWQSLCTGHVDASLENSVALAFVDGERPERR